MNLTAHKRGKTMEQEIMLNEQSRDITDDKVAIRVENLWMSYKSNLVLQGVNLQVRDGEVVVIIGPSGCGKSTLLRCMNLLEIPQDGRIFLKGQCITDGKIQPHKVRRRIGMVFQQFNLFPHMTILENVMEGLVTVLKTEKEEAIEQAVEMLKRVGLQDKKDAKPSSLSGGQQQRVAIARALAMKPEVMLFDEVTSALDPELRAEVLNVMRQLAADGMTMVVVTHEMGFARKVGDWVAFLDQGKVIEQGKPEKVLENPTTDRLCNFLNLILWNQ